MKFSELSRNERFILEIAVLLPLRFKKSDLLRYSRELGEKSFLNEFDLLVLHGFLFECPEDLFCINENYFKISLESVLFSKEFSKISNYLKYEFLNHSNFLTDDEKYFYTRILFYRGTEDIFGKIDEIKKNQFLNRIYSEMYYVLQPDFWNRVHIHKAYKKGFINFLLDSVLGGYKYEDIHINFLEENRYLFSEVEKEKFDILQIVRGEKSIYFSQTELSQLWSSILIMEIHPISPQKKYGDYKDFLIFFSILKKGISANSQNLYGFLNHILSSKNHPFQYEFLCWKNFLDFLRGENPEIILRIPEDENFWKRITYLLIRRWADLDIPSFPNPITSRPDWFSVQLESTSGGTYQFSIGYPLSVLFQKPPDWILRLESLKEYLGKFTRAPIFRLYWILVYDDSERRFLSIVPELREFTSRGWVVGKTPSLSQLFNQQDKFSYLSGYDLKILKKIIQKTIDLKGSRVYEIDLDDPRFLEGHPYLMLPEGEPILLKNKEPILVIENRENILFELVPTPPFEDGTIVVRNSSTVFHCYYFSPELLKIYEYLGGGKKTFPLLAEEKLFPILDTLSRYFSIHASSSFNFHGIPRLETDPVLHIEVSQIDGVYCLSINIKPNHSSVETYIPFSGPVLLWERREDSLFILERNFQLENEIYEEFMRSTELLKYARSLSPFQYEFLNFQNYLLFLANSGSRYEPYFLDETIEVRGKISFENIFFRITVEGDFFRIEGRVYFPGNLELNLSSIWESFMTTNVPRYLEVDRGVFYLFLESLESRLEEIFLLLQFIKGFAYIPIKAIYYMNELLSDFSGVDTDSRWKFLIERFEKSADLGIETLDTSPLREYQKQGVLWMLRRLQNDLGVCLADDMGLGKTLQTLYVLRNLLPKGPFLLVVPTSLLESWVEELKIHISEIKVFMVEDLEKGIIPGTMHLIPITYSYLQNEENAERISRIAWEGIILDEAQMIKNSVSKRFKNLSRIKARKKIALTGTPMENHPGELWSIFEFINPGLLGSRDVFKNKYEIPIHENKLNNLYSLQKLIFPYILRRQKKDVLPELPRKEEIVVPIELSRDEREVYEKIRESALELIKDALIPDAQKKVRILSILMKLRRICCHRNLVYPGIEHSSEKLYVFQNLLVELLQAGERVLVFSQFTDYLSIVEAFLQKAGISYKYLDGSVQRKKRAEAVKDFQRGFGEVFLISLRAGGFGLNLTSASSVVHLDPWWNPAVEAQASDRVYRIGQTKPVKIYKLITMKTVEEKILSLHARKMEMAENILEFTKMENYTDIEVIRQILEESI